MDQALGVAGSVAKKNFAARLAQSLAAGNLGPWTNRHQRRHVAGSPHQLALRRQRSPAIDHDPRRQARPRRPGGQQRIIDRRRAAADDNGFNSAPQRVNQGPRRFAGDPAAVASTGGDLAVERHGPLGDDPRSAGRKQLQIGSVEPPRFRLADAGLDGDAGRSQLGDPAAIDLGKGIAQCENDAVDAGRDDRAGAGGRLAVMATRLQRGIKSRAPRPWPGNCQGLNLGVRSAEAAVPAFADDLRP